MPSLYEMIFRTIQSNGVVEFGWISKMGKNFHTSEVKS